MVGLSVESEWVWPRGTFAFHNGPSLKKLSLKRQSALDRSSEPRPQPREVGLLDWMTRWAHGALSKTFLAFPELNQTHVRFCDRFLTFRNTVWDFYHNSARDVNHCFLWVIDTVFYFNRVSSIFIIWKDIFSIILFRNFFEIFIFEILGYYLMSWYAYFHSKYCNFTLQDSCVLKYNILITRPG